MGVQSNAYIRNEYAGGCNLRLVAKFMHFWVVWFGCHCYHRHFMYFRQIHESLDT